jgi:hypothetical protein
MQLAVFMTEESRVICRDFGAEVLKGPNPLLSHPGTGPLAGPVGEGITEAGLGRCIGDGLQLQASAGVEVHGEQRLAAVESSAWDRQTDRRHRPSHAAMANPAPTIETDLEAVTAALAGVEPRPGRVLLFGSYWHVVARALREGKELHLGSLR